MLEKFFNMSLDLFCVANNEGFFVKVSPSFSEVLGYREEELLSRPYIDFIHPDDLKKTQVTVGDILNLEADVESFENRYRCKDGSYRFLSWRSRVDPEDKLIYAVARDVTKLKESQVELNQFRQILTDNHIIAFTDKAGRITKVNDKFCEISGYAREELLGQTHQVVNSGVHSKEFWKELWKTISSGKAWNGVIENRAKDGTHYFVSSTIAPILDIYQNISGYVAIRFEVTNEVNAKNDHKRAMEILNETNSIARVGGWELIVETGELNWTEETFKILEVEKKDGSKPVLAEGLELFVPEHKPIIDNAVRNGIEKGQPYSLELKAQTAKGNVLWVYTNGRAHYKDGKVSTLSGTIQDIDLRKKAELKIDEERKKTEQSAKLAAIGELSAGIAHEINNPLTALLGNSEILALSKELSEKDQEKVERINRSAKRIHAIARQLTKFARSSQDDKFAQVALSEIISEVMLLATAKAKKFSCSIQVPEETTTILNCNQVEIEQVLINLINNGIDAIKDKDERWIKLEVEENSELIKIKVIDSGEGIDTETANTLFEPFFTTKAAGEGTGLGLSISKGIIEKHQGKMYIDYDAHNTTFVIEFPNNQ